MTPIGAGVVGVGRLGAVHARLLAASERFTLVGVHDIDESRAAEVAEGNGARVFETAEALASECDAIVVAVPTALHAEIAGVCLDADCHLLVEKPLAATPEEARGIVSDADDRGVVLAVGHVERFNGVVLACEPFLERPRFIESLRIAAFQPRGTDVNVVLDLMIHDIDLVSALVGRPVVSVDAIGTPVMTGSIDMANARLKFEGGAVADISASRVSLQARREMRLYEDAGYFSLDLAAGRGTYLRRSDRPPEGASGITDLVERIELVPEPGEPLEREIDGFADAISGRPSRLVRGAAGVQALEVAARITRQIEESADVFAEDS
ncbi:MAG: Gfo/Idh/MocA family oxidoreductase [Gemmatimonadota bacterium]|nr:Gfo/Idh/MocA family oxidoreductase [Gemmatimonadota bacterium]